MATERPLFGTAGRLAAVVQACIFAAIAASAAAAVTCPPGYYATSETSCAPCAENTYRSGLDPQSACLPCATGSTSPEAASACTECPAGYTIDNTGTCKPCGRNTFNPTPGTVGDACKPCPAGQLAPFGASTCAACPPGRFIPASAANAPSPDYVGDCIDCAANTYSDTPNSRTCKACPAGTSKPGSKACDPCPAGSYLKQEYSWGPITCEPCPIGSYSTEAGSVQCTACPFGSSSYEGSTSCELCPPGAFVYSVPDVYGYGQCTACPRNTYNDQPGFSGESCKPCPEGFTAVEEGSTKCEQCPAGSYVGKIGSNTFCSVCPANTYTTQPGTVGGCSPCPEGTWSLGGATECIQCPAGSYGRGFCRECPPATYQDEAGTEECKACPEGYTTKPGARNVLHCKICPAGGYIDAETGECLPCPEDTYSDTLGTVGSCKACPARTAAPKGSSHPGHCRLCPPGRYFVAGHDGEPTGHCLPCPINTFSSAEGLVADICEPCPVGTTSGEGATECTPCAPGSFYQVGVTTPDPYLYVTANCAYCPVGFYSTEPKSLECTPCPLGSTTGDVGATKCTPCSGKTSGSEILGVPTCAACDRISAAGAFTCPAGSGRVTGCAEVDKCEACPAGTIGGPSPDFGRDACVPCPIGHIAATANLTTCTPCAAGSSTDRIGASECHVCKPGYYAALPGDPCKACPPGTFASANGSTSCTPCAAGTTHFLAARVSQEECTVAHVAGTTITATEAFEDRDSTSQYDEGSKILTTKLVVSTAPSRTVTLVAGGDPVAPPPGYTQRIETTTSGLNTSPPETTPFIPAKPTFAYRYSLFQRTVGNVVGGTASDDFVVLVEHIDDGFEACGTRRGADGKLDVVCDRLIQSGGSPNMAYSQTEYLTLVGA
ncbi:hypothetical protein HYH03_005699 [Edaphochlamys debaryana]|uniref:Tyrosine-protein kinase ephrin type A/B receptor-like domain-containing protein n=1 Tax=Edaphochlamys debaryana TaxID=47281 RepID=A0A835Y4Z7_9CHLO|nr:hypothetical protein HYH03_005699 [Edaphochlamys debaryana]|eukprot:KAG2496096.1 hypothetical protein HYH03_005699 [Edaphochlamys debaryana]